MTSAPPPLYGPPEKVRDEQVRPSLPGVATDTLFFAIATVAVAWLAFRLLQEAWSYSWWHLLLLIPFWALVAYLVLPRIHFLLTRIYVPGYFIARSRTSDGLLGDPVNLAFDGTARQIHAAMAAANWTLADPITVRSSWGIIVSSVTKRSYPEAPVSPLTLFGRAQCLAYQQEVEGNAAQRHHVRFWRCPDGWLLPGGHRVQWLAAGTYDRAVGLSLFTLQVTHKIDADIDIERDYIVQSVQHARPEVTRTVIEDFSTGYHCRNGGGDEVRTDGNLPIVNLRAVAPTPETTLPPQVAIAAHGYDDPEAEGGVASADPDAPALTDQPERERLPRPWSIVLACALAAIAAILTAIYGVWSVRSEVAGQPGVGPLSRDELTLFFVIVMAMLAVVYGLILLVAWLTYRGFARPRVIFMALVVLGIITDELSRSASRASSASLADAGLAVNVLILLALTSQSARVWSRRMSVLRKEARLAGQRQRKSR